MLLYGLKRLAKVEPTSKNVSSVLSTMCYNKFFPGEPVHFSIPNDFYCGKDNPPIDLAKIIDDLFRELYADIFAEIKPKIVQLAFSLMLLLIVLLDQPAYLAFLFPYKKF